MSVTYSFTIESYIVAPGSTSQTCVSSFTVDQIDTIGTPKPINYWNQFDEHGLIVGVSRKTGEKVWSHRRRLFDAFTNIANSTYRGLVNGITRELGLELYSPVILQPRLSPITNKFYAVDPYIKINEAYIYLYSDYANDILECKIDRFKEGGNYEKLTWLVDIINQTTYFEAGLVDYQYRLDNAMVLVNQTNRGIYSEKAQNSTRFQLKYKYIVPGTVKFIDGSSIFKVEMRHIDEVDRSGRFYIDYNNGIITSYNLPPVDTTIQYQYNKYPFYPTASQVIINNFCDNDFKVKLFEQILLENGDYADSLPTELGNDLLNEILSIYPMYWGI